MSFVAIYKEDGVEKMVRGDTWTSIYDLLHSRNILRYEVFAFLQSINNSPSAIMGREIRARKKMQKKDTMCRGT